MPEIPEFLTPEIKDSKDSTEILRWHTITYRSVALWLVVVLAIVVGVLWIIYPNLWVTLASYLPSTKSAAKADANQGRQARFTNLEGEVRVKKANQVQWGRADVAMELEEGDTVQTLRDSMARVAFSDGALYVVKPDTLIVIEGITTHDQAAASNVAVRVTSGAVDLSTSRGGGDSHVTFANAEARIHQESRAVVSNNPQTDTHEITVSKGGASLQRGGERLELAQFEQASFAGPNSRLLKAKLVAPPILLTPSNMAPVALAGSPTAEVEFTWSTVPAATAYRLRISASPVFSSTLLDRRLQSTSIRLPSFKEGNYYWSVATVEGQKESQQSDANQFSVTKRGEQGELLLVVDKYVQHGKVIEIIGRTEPGATVLVNNEPVFNVAPNGAFKHFTAPLANVGANQIAITAQNSNGKIATLRKTVTIQ